MTLSCLLVRRHVRESDRVVRAAGRAAGPQRGLLTWRGCGDGRAAAAPGQEGKSESPERRARSGASGGATGTPVGG